MYQVFCWWPVYIPAVLIHSRFSRPHFCWWKQTPLRDNYELAAVMCLNFREHVFPCKNQSPAPEMRTVFRKILPRLLSICDLRSQTFSTTSYMGLSQNLDPLLSHGIGKVSNFVFPTKTAQVLWGNLRGMCQGHGCVCPDGGFEKKLRM
jgi:hypothetical protein